MNRFWLLFFPLVFVLINSVNASGPLAWSSWTASSNPITTGSTQTLTATWTGGTSSYTVNFLVYNSLGLEYNALYSGISGTTNSFSFIELGGVQTITANVVVTDSLSGKITNTLTYNVQAPSPSITQYSCNFIEANSLFTSNKVYQNNAIIANTLVLYATTNGMITGWQNYSSTFKFIAFSAGGAQSLSNFSSTMYIPPGNYFKLNYTGITTFTEQCIILTTNSTDIGFLSISFIIIGLCALLLEKKDWLWKGKIISGAGVLIFFLCITIAVILLT